MTGSKEKKDMDDLLYQSVYIYDLFNMQIIPM